MKQTIRQMFIGSLLALMLLCLAGMGLTMFSRVLAEEPADDTVEYVTIDATEMYIGYSESAVKDPASGDITLNNGCRVGFTNIPGNTEMTATVNFSVAAGQICLVMRGSADSVLPVPYEGSGYAFMYYATGQYTLYKNGTDLTGVQWGPLPAFSIGADYDFSMKTVDLADGSGVAIAVTVNGSAVITYTDTSDPVMSGGMAGFVAQNGAAFTLKGKPQEGNAGAVDPTDFSAPIAVQDVALTTVENASMHWDSLPMTGAAFTIRTDSYYAIKASVQPQGGAMYLSLGSFRTSTNAMQMLTTIDPQWGWRDSGYYLYWQNDGVASVTRSYWTEEGVKTRSFPVNITGFGPGSAFDLEFGFESAGGGIVKVYLKLNGSYAFTVYDSPTEDGYEPYRMRTASPSDQTMNTLIYGAWCAAEWQFTPDPEVNTGTQTERDLGQPDYVSANTSVNRNGEIVSFSDGGTVFGYNSVAVNSVKAVFRFDAVGAEGEAVILMLRTPGVILSPWGVGSGYALQLKANGQFALTKNGGILCEGWAPYNGLSAADTDFVIEYGAVDVADDAVRIFAYVNDVCILDFVDIGDVLHDSGYVVYNSVLTSGFKGSVLAEGVEFPVIAADKQQVTLQETVLLSCRDVSADAEYLIDTEKSTGNAVIDGNVFTPKAPGEVYVYAKAGGLYSDILCITIAGMAVNITNIPVTALTARGESYQLEYEVLNGDDGGASFAIVQGKGTGNASLTEGGLFTPVDAGTVFVTATVGGVTSSEYTIFIAPEIWVDDTSSMAVGEVKNGVGFRANCLLPDEEYQIVYELVDGEEYVDMNVMGQLQAKAIGIFHIKVRVIGETFSAVSEVAGIQIEAPVVTLLGVDDMVVGESLRLYPSINKGIEIKSAVISVISGEELIDIEDNVVTAKKAGVVRLCAIVNGFASGELWFSIADRMLSVIAGDMWAADTQTLDVMFNSSELTVESVEYSIAEGGQYATLAGNVLKSGNMSGKVVVRALVNGEYTAEVTVNIRSGITLGGVYDDAIVAVGSSIPLSYRSEREEPAVQVQYEVVFGKDFAYIEGNRLIVTGAGSIGVCVIADGIYSDTVHISSYSASSPIAVLKGVYEGARFAVGSEIALGYEYSGVEEAESVVYEIVSGTSLGSIDGNSLLVLGAGEIGLRVVVNGTVSGKVTIIGYEAEQPIAVLLGVYDGARFTVGDEFELSYAFSGGKAETVEYKVLSGGSSVSLRGNILSLDAKGEAKLCVVVNGIASETVTIGISEPVVTLVGGIYDGARFTVGDRLQLGYLYSGSNVETVAYEVVSGEETVDLDGNILIVVGEGEFSLRVIVNGFASPAVKATAEKSATLVTVLTGVYDGLQTAVGSQITLSYFYSGTEEVFSAVYEIADGSGLAVLDKNVLTVTGAGRIGLKVTVNGVASPTVYITAFAAEKPVAVLLGITDGQEIAVGEQIKLSYFYSGGEATDVVYELVAGDRIAGLKDGVLSVVGAGDISVRVTVDGVSSETLTVHGYAPETAPDDADHTLVIVLGCVSAALLAGLVAVGIIFLNKKRRG